MSNDIDKQLAAKAKFKKLQAEAEEEAALRAKKEKQEQLKKEAAAKAKLPIQKHYYDVKVECTLPAVLTYKVLAEDAYQAADMIKHMQPTSVKHRLIGRKETKLSVYDSGSTMIRFIKNLFR